MRLILNLLLWSLCRGSFLPLSVNGYYHDLSQNRRTLFFLDFWLYLHIIKDHLHRNTGKPREDQVRFLFEIVYVQGNFPALYKGTNYNFLPYYIILKTVISMPNIVIPNITTK